MQIKRNTQTFGTFFRITDKHTIKRSFYLPRRKEIRVPNPPMNPRIMMNNPAGTRFAESRFGRKVGTTSSGGGVNVGKRVGVTGSMKAATRVGSIVGVDNGVGVLGAGIRGSRPVLMMVT